MPKELKENIVQEPAGIYENNIRELPTTYINPFEDWVFKKIFASETSKEIVKAFLNEILAGKRQIETIEYGKNEYPGEIKDEANTVFDFICTDIDGTAFLVEVQRQEQKHFKERSLFYTSRLISDQAPKGDRKWKYNLKEIYSVSLLENFCLPNTKANVYRHNVSLCNTDTGEVFYEKLHFIYIEVMKFSKEQNELETNLDQWLYALKHASKLKEEPRFLKAPGLNQFLYLAKYTNLTKEERNMFRTAQQVRWDNENVWDFAIEKAEHKKSVEFAKAMLADSIPITQIIKYTQLSEQEIVAIKQN